MRRGISPSDPPHGSDTIALEWLLQAKANPNVPAVFIVANGIYPFGLQVTPLHIACGFPDMKPVAPDIVDLLLQNGANPFAQASPGMWHPYDPSGSWNFF